MIKIRNEYKLIEARERCRGYRKRILDISQNVSALHAAGAFSCTEIVDTIYYALMRKENNQLIDEFILSKGHSCILQYLILNDLGYLTDNDIISLNIDDYEFNKDDCGWINILKKNIVCCNMLKYIEKIEHCNY